MLVIFLVLVLLDPVKSAYPPTKFFSSDEKNLGTICIDLGHSTTSIATINKRNEEIKIIESLKYLKFIIKTS